LVLVALLPDIDAVGGRGKRCDRFDHDRGRLMGERMSSWEHEAEQQFCIRTGRRMVSLLSVVLVCSPAPWNAIVTNTAWGGMLGFLNCLDDELLSAFVFTWRCDDRDD
jgi:hypothetical protein